eukprot:1626124-Pyramimonas_sp.AAC.1
MRRRRTSVNPRVINDVGIQLPTDVGIHLPVEVGNPTPRIHMIVAPWRSCIVSERHFWDFNTASQRNCCALRTLNPSKSQFVVQ